MRPFAPRRGTCRKVDTLRVPDASLGLGPGGGLTEEADVDVLEDAPETGRAAGGGNGELILAGEAAALCLSDPGALVVDGASSEGVGEWEGLLVAFMDDGVIRSR